MAPYGHYRNIFDKQNTVLGISISALVSGSRGSYNDQYCRYDRANISSGEFEVEGLNLDNCLSQANDALAELFRLASDF
jgi:hypothetical protein